MKPLPMLFALVLSGCAATPTSSTYYTPHNERVPLLSDTASATTTGAAIPRGDKGKGEESFAMRERVAPMPAQTPRISPPPRNASPPPRIPHPVRIK